MIWRALTTLIEAIFLTGTVIGKEVILPDGEVLGLATDIQIDLKQGQTWVLVNQKGNWTKIASEKISVLSNEAVFTESRFDTNRVSFNHVVCPG